MGQINEKLQEMQTSLEAAEGKVPGTDAVERKDQMSVVDYKMVSFSLAGKDYAIDIMSVKEIAKAGRFTYVPNTMPFVIGVYNLRGEIIPIVDLRIFFNIEVPERKEDALENLLIITVGEQTFGVVVDAIDKVVGIQKSSIQPPHPLFGDINIKYIYGVVESNNRLYILLDIERIFGAKSAQEAEKDAAELKSSLSQKVQVSSSKVSSISAPSASSSKKAQGAKAEEKSKEAEKADVDYPFILESLKSLRKFEVSAVNESWTKSRYSAWAKERGAGKSQLQNEADADAFLQPFFSQCNANWWSKDYADAIYAALPDNSAKQISVWNPGCGKGYEAYSLACLLKKRYPSAKIRIYAQDIDLLSVSNAPLLSIPSSAAQGWYAPYVSKKVNGDFTFSQEIKDSVMFEYHDCMNTNAMPMLDMIFCRDVISFLPSSSLPRLFEDFDEKLKGNGVIIVGDNESLSSVPTLNEKMVGQQLVYTKQ